MLSRWSGTGPWTLLRGSGGQRSSPPVENAISTVCPGFSAVRFLTSVGGGIGLGVPGRFLAHLLVRGRTRWYALTPGFHDVLSGTFCYGLIRRLPGSWSEGQRRRNVRRIAAVWESNRHTPGLSHGCFGIVWNRTEHQDMGIASLPGLLRAVRNLRESSATSELRLLCPRLRQCGCPIRLRGSATISSPALNSNIAGGAHRCARCRPQQIARG